MNPREQRGLEIAARYKLTRRGNIWRVPSQSGKQPYTVDFDSETPSCTCPDNEVNRRKCKHIFAVEITKKREQGDKEKTTIAEAAPAKVARPTYKQKWREYNAAQVNEKSQFQLLLYELCWAIEEPVQTFGRPRASLRDMIFSAAFKVYSTISGRRSSDDMREAQKKGYVSKAPHYNTVFKYLELEDLTPYLRDLITRSSLPLKAIEEDFAVDSSGFSIGKSVTWFNAKYGREVDNKDWIKMHLMCGVKTNIVTSVEISGRHANDSPYFKPLVKATAKNFKLKQVSGDKAYSSRPNLRLVTELKATPYVAFKKNSKEGEECEVWNNLFHYYSLHREEFLVNYHKRSNVESTFNMIKAKFDGHLSSKTDTAQINEALCKVLCHNICCVIQSIYEFGIEPNFAFGT